MAAQILQDHRQRIARLPVRRIERQGRSDQLLSQQVVPSIMSGVAAPEEIFRQRSRTVCHSRLP